MNYTTNRNSSDRFSIFATNENEVRLLSRKLKYPIDDVLSAIQEVGLNRDEIAQYIEDRRNRM